MEIWSSTYLTGLLSLAQEVVQGHLISWEARSHNKVDARGNANVANCALLHNMRVIDTIPWRCSFPAPLIDCISPLLPHAGAALPENGSIPPGDSSTGLQVESRLRRRGSSTRSQYGSLGGSAPTKCTHTSGETACSTHYMLAPPAMI